MLARPWRPSFLPSRAAGTPFTPGTVTIPEPSWSTATKSTSSVGPVATTRCQGEWVVIGGLCKDSPCTSRLSTRTRADASACSPIGVSPGAPDPRVASLAPGQRETASSPHPKPDYGSGVRERLTAGDEARARDPYLGKVILQFCIRGKGRNRPLNEYFPPISTGIHADHIRIHGNHTGLRTGHRFGEG